MSLLDETRPSEATQLLFAEHELVPGHYTLGQMRMLFLQNLPGIDTDRRADHLQKAAEEIEKSDSDQILLTRSTEHLQLPLAPNSALEPLFNQYEAIRNTSGYADQIVFFLRDTSDVFSQTMSVASEGHIPAGIFKAAALICYERFLFLQVNETEISFDFLSKNIEAEVKYFSLLYTKITGL